MTKRKAAELNIKYNGWNYGGGVKCRNCPMDCEFKEVNPLSSDCVNFCKQWLKENPEDKEITQNQKDFFRTAVKKIDYGKLISDLCKSSKTATCKNAFPKFVLCQDCLRVEPYTNEKHDGTVLCECGGEFCGCWACEAQAKEIMEIKKIMNTPISKDILNRIEHLEELAGVKNTTQNQKDFFKELAESMENHGVTDIYGWTSHDKNSLIFNFNGDEVELEERCLNDIKKLAE